LLQQWFVEVILGVEVRADFRRQDFFTVKRTTGRDADQKERDRDQHQQGRDQAEETRGGVA
jgi:hypothetical protein